MTAPSSRPLRVGDLRKVLEHRLQMAREWKKYHNAAGNTNDADLFGAIAEITVCDLLEFNKSSGVSADIQSTADRANGPTNSLTDTGCDATPASAAALDAIAPSQPETGGDPYIAPIVTAIEALRWQVAQYRCDAKDFAPGSRQLIIAGQHLADKATAVLSAWDQSAPPEEQRETQRRAESLAAIRAAVNRYDMEQACGNAGTVAEAGHTLAAAVRGYLSALDAKGQA